MTRLKGQKEAVLNKLNSRVGGGATLEPLPLPLYYWVTGLGEHVVTIES